MTQMKGPREISVIMSLRSVSGEENQDISLNIKLNNKI